MSEDLVNRPFRGVYTASLPATQEEVTASDVFYVGRRMLERNQQFKPTYWGDAVGTLNVNTDKMRHRPSDIMDYMNRARPLPSMNIN